MSKGKWDAGSSQGTAVSRRLVRAVVLSSGVGAAVAGLAFGSATTSASASPAVKAGWYAETGVSAAGAGSQPAGQAFLRSAAAVAPKVIGYQTKKVDPGGKGVAHTVSFGALQYPNGLRVFCIDGLLLAPSSNPSKPISKTDQKQLSYLLSRYSTSNDKTTVAAVSYISRQLLDTGWSFDAKAFKTLPASVQSAVTKRVGQLRSEAASYVGGYTPAVTNTADKPDDSGAVRSGTATVTMKASTGKPVPGVPFTATVSGGGQFAGGKTTVAGSTGTGPVRLAWTAPKAKDGDRVQVKVSYTGVPAVSYYQYDAPRLGEQRVIGSAPSGSAGQDSPAATVHVPTASAATRVSTHVWKPGQRIVDVLTTKGVEGSPKIDVTAAAGIMPRPQGVSSCADVTVAQWEKAFTAGKVSTISTARVTGADSNRDVRVPLQLDSHLPDGVTSGDWCGSINENVWRSGTRQRLLVTKFGEVNEWGSLTVAKKPAPPVKPPVIPTGGLSTAPTSSDPAAGGGLLAAGVLVGGGTFWLNRRRKSQTTT